MQPHERRRHPRREKVAEFFCYVNGHRFDSESLDISEGGAFLATPDAPSALSLVIVVPKELQRANSGVALVGAVRRQQTTPVPGVGIEWLRCISRRGIDDVRSFLQTFLEVPERRLPEPDHAVLLSPVAAYNFRAERFYVPDLPAEGETGVIAGPITCAPDEGAPASVSEPADYHRRGGLGIMTNFLGADEGRVPIDLPVRIVLGEAAFEARARAVGTRAVIVAAPEPLDLDGGMVILHFPIPLRDGTSWVRMLCAASPLEGGESLDFKALDLRIVEMLHEGNPGVFERFVRYLCQRMLAQEQDGE